MKLFLSYRREDSTHVTGRIFDRLQQAFGIGNVFKDVDSIPPGAQFRHVLNEAIDRCDVVLAVIGDRWLGPDVVNQGSRLDSEEDFIRVELETAIRRQRPIVPVLVGHLGLPTAQQLPTSLVRFLEFQAATIRSDPHFHPDVTALIGDLRRRYSRPLWRSFIQVMQGPIDKSIELWHQWQSRLLRRRNRYRYRNRCPKCLGVGLLRPIKTNLGIEKFECTNVVVEDPFEDCRFTISPEDLALEKVSIPMLGVAEAGKTMWLAIAAHLLPHPVKESRVEFNKIPSIGSEWSQSAWDQLVNSRISLSATRDDSLPEPVMFRFGNRLQNRAAMLSLFDFAGAISINAIGSSSWNTTGDQFRQRALLSDGLMLVLDPTKHIDTQFEMLDGIVNDLSMLLNIPSHQTLPVPIAVGISKIDILANEPQLSGLWKSVIAELEYIDSMLPGINTSAIERRSRLFIELSKVIWPSSDLAGFLTSRFGNKWKLFPYTSIGLSEAHIHVKCQLDYPGEPRYILEPLYWLLQESGYRILAK